MWSVLTGKPVPEPRLAGLTVGLLTKPPSVGGPALPENRAAEQYVERLEQLGARVVAGEIPEPADDTWPLFFGEAAESHRATFPERADDYGDERAREARARADRRARRRSSGAQSGHELAHV